GPQAGLARLARSLRSASSGGQPPSEHLLAFRGREAELDMVLRGLTSPAGPHFWLVTAPPQFGKTWFLAELGAELESTAAEQAWTVRKLDLRDVASDARWDVRALLARLFNRSSSGSWQRELVDIAREIAGSGTSFLVVLDSAELLDHHAAASLRSYLGE